MSLPSNTHPGVAVDTFSVSDKDLNDNHTFKITGGTTNDYFEISGEYLMLPKKLPAAAMNYWLM